MTELDQILQQNLEDLENGQPLVKVLMQLPEQSGETADLVRLGHAIGQIRHPVMRAKITPALRAASARPAVRWPWQSVTLAAGLSIAAMLVVVMVVTATALALWVAGPASARTATLVDTAGSVEVASGVLSEDWKIVSDGYQLHAGQRIRTAAGAATTLVFFEGSRASLAASSQVFVNTMKGGWNRAINVLIDQESGITTHSVVPLRGRKSSYQVATPAGTVEVHGTRFEVNVETDGSSRIAVDTGEVVLSGQQSRVVLAAGQATYARAGGFPEAPAYQFSLVGRLAIPDNNQLSVNGVQFRLESPVTASFAAGSLVAVQGRIVAGERVADSITPAGESGEYSVFTGVLENVDGNPWQVSGHAVYVDTDTEMEGPLLVGTPVKVKFFVMENGDWLALKIESLEEEGDPTPEPTVEETAVITSTATITPTVTLTPTLTATPVITITPMITPTVFVNCTGANPQPKGQELADRYGVPYEEIMGWFCKHYGFGEIDLAYGLGRQYGLPVEQIFALRASGLGWGEIKKLVAAGLPTGTPSATSTPSPVVSATPPAPTQPTDPCRGGKPHPTGQKLAARFGVPYEEIIGWFCQGFGFGEIDHAYSLSIQTGTPPAQIFAMRSSGMGWGEIEALLAPKPARTEKPKKKP